MRITLTKYISKEIWSIFLTCLTVFLFIIMASQMFNMTGLLVNYGADLGDLSGLMLRLIPRFILIAMPAACLMAVLLSFIRMSSDNEIIALHSSGVSLYQLMPPVIIFSLICALFTAFLTLFWAPYGNRTSESVLLNIMKTSVESQIKEGVFLERKDVVFYVNNYSPKDKILKDVFVVDKSKGKERTVVARNARFISDGNNIVLRLTDYKVFADGSEGETITAESLLPLNYPIPIDTMMGESDGDELEPMDMYFDELSKLIYNSKEEEKIRNIAKLTLYEMFSLPAAVLLITIAGAPLGAHIRAHGRTKGIVISLLLFLSYYIILTFVRYMCEHGTVNPAVGAWVPVLFLLIMSAALLVRSASDLPFNIFRRSGLMNTHQKA